MDSPREIWSRLRLWLRSDEMEREMDEEMRFHIEKLIERNVRDGMSPEEARRTALVRFGGVERFKEESRRESRPRLLEELLQDLRYGLRALRRNPGFTLVAVLTLGLGIGARDWPEIAVRRVSAGYFPTLGVPLVRGRLFQDGDGPKAPPVMLVNEEAVRRFFQGRDPLGQKISFWRTEWTIVGIVSNERFLGLAETPPPAVYAPLAQAPSVNGAGCLLVRATGDLATLIPEVRGAIRELDPGLAVFGEEPLATTLAESVGQQRFTMLLLAAFAGLALVLAVVGVYGVLSFVVVQRAPEMGIRMALGATQRTVIRQVVWQGARLALVGLALAWPAPSS